MNEKELQEKLITYRLIEARIESLLKQREILIKTLMELENTIEGIEELEKKSEDLLFSIGSQTYMPARIIEKNKLIVEIGANVALEKSLEDGKKILEKRREEIEKSVESIETAINQLSSKLKEIDEEVKKFFEKKG